MPRVTILSRERLLQFPEPNRPETQVALTYQTELLPPRTIFLPNEPYEDVPADSPEAAGGIVVTPKDEAAQAAEDAAIRKDIESVQAFAPPTREI